MSADANAGEERKCQCGHPDFEHAGKTHLGNQCLGDDLACPCERFARSGPLHNANEGATILLTDAHALMVAHTRATLGALRAEVEGMRVSMVAPSRWLFERTEREYHNNAVDDSLARIDAALARTVP